MPRKAYEPAPLPALTGLSWHSQLVVGVTCIGAFLGQLDASIVQLALPVLQESFNATVNQVRWVAIAYLLAFATFLPVGSRICEMFGRKLLYLVGFTVFGVASLLCSLASDLPSLIAFRAVQGVGASLLGANSIAIIVRSVPQQSRASALGWFTTAQAVGISAGPVAGGLLLDSLGWPSIFWVGVPFAVLAVIAGWLILPRTTDLSDETFDGPGALFLMPSLLLAVFVLNQTSVWPLLSLQMLSCAGAAVLFLGLFVWRERRAASPLIDLGLFAHPVFNAGILGVALSYALLYGTFFLVSYALVHGYQDSTRISGLKLAAVPVAIGLVAPLATSLVQRWGARLVCTAGMVVCIAALLSMVAISIWWRDNHHPLGIAALALFGVGLGLFMGPNSHATIEAAPPARSTTASGMVNLMRTLGTCFGVSSASSIMAWRLAQRTSPDGLDRVYHGRIVLEAVDVGLFVLVAFAVVAALASLVRPAKRS